MSIENLLSDLITALNNNTAAHLASKGTTVTEDVKTAEPVAEKPKATRGSKKAEKAPEPEPVVEEEETEVTLEECTELSAILLENEIADRNTLKAKINKLGFNTMKEMDGAARAKMYDYMSELYNDANQAPAEEEL